MLKKKLEAGVKIMKVCCNEDGPQLSCGNWRKWIAPANLSFSRFVGALWVYYFMQNMPLFSEGIQLWLILC